MSVAVQVPPPIKLNSSDDVRTEAKTRHNSPRDVHMYYENDYNYPVCNTCHGRIGSNCNIYMFCDKMFCSEQCREAAIEMVSHQRYY